MSHDSNAAPLPIGVFDSGVGGLTVLREIRRLLPAESTLYLGDTARVPYGTKSPQTVTRYARENTHLLAARGIKLLVVACNTASALALEALRGEFPLPLTGVIEPGARAALAATKSGQVGVIATSATVRSGAYERSIKGLGPSLSVKSQACPLFVSLAEEGWTEGEVAQKVAERYLAGLRGSGVDVVVLGCTHYPLLSGVITSVLGAGIAVIDSARATAQHVAGLLRQSGLEAPGGGPASHGYLVTDSRERFLDLAPRFLGMDLGGPVEEVGLEA